MMFAVSGLLQHKPTVGMRMLTTVNCGLATVSCLLLYIHREIHRLVGINLFRGHKISGRRLFFILSGRRFRFPRISRCAVFLLRSRFLPRRRVRLPGLGEADAMLRDWWEGERGSPCVAPRLQGIS